MIIEDITKVGKEYGLIYADPPWKQSKGGRSRSEQTVVENR